VGELFGANLNSLTLNNKVEALEKEIAYLKLLNQNGIKI
jgi:hypothetical protein